MKLFAGAAGFGITPGFGARTGAHVRDTQGDKTIAQLSGFASGQHDAGGRRSDAKRADELHEFCIADGMKRLVAALGLVDARKRDVDLRFPAMPFEIAQVAYQRECFETPISQSEQSRDPQVFDTGACGSSRGIDAPMTFFLRGTQAALSIRFGSVC